ncbi:hypothetical protein AY600_04800 [Phormidium willei BDU 130791]|nr:hypothetical protein AY600_04800 [Phormidium willei BDU 130791]
MSYRPDDIAIISLAGRFPGANTVEEFWQNLAAGVESVRRFEPAEVQAAGVSDAQQRDCNYVPAGAPLADIDGFDAQFFGYNPKEASLMDPQQRIFLELAWEALERAGYAPNHYPGSVAVYGGVSSNDYWRQLQQRPDLTAAVGDYQTLLGNDKDFLSTRVSYKLNLTGPSLTVQTACSSSLVATVLAYQSLLTYQCDLALAGGVSIHSPQTAGYCYQPGGIFSQDGHCRPFDAQAQGTVGGNGAGIVVLKRLEEAMADGDPIYGVIRGAALSNDGAAKVGYTAPSVGGQAAAIAQALVLAEVESESLSYVEAHGTGTALGDPIEVTALSQAFASSTRQFCALGSVKGNIGHLDAAAGIAGLIKTSLALHHRQLPPSLHFQQPNPQIDFANSPFYVNRELSPWSGQTPRRAGVSAMGIGGTNAHVVLQEAPERLPSGPSRPWQLLPLSAKTPQALERAQQNLLAHLQTDNNLNLADVAYTLTMGRTAFEQRQIWLCGDRADAITQLQATAPTPIPTQERVSIAFLCPGQGSQSVDMARELYEQEPRFREVVDDCCEQLWQREGLDLRSHLYPDHPGSETAPQLNDTALAQPALFVIDYALAQLWLTWSIEPQALLGHSLGEYVAACLAGVFSLADALTLVTRRGQLMQGMPPGRMLSVPLAAEDLAPYLGDEVWLAVHNGPKLSALSGTPLAIAELEARFQAEGLPYRLLKTSHGFHCPLMAAAREPLMDLLRQMSLQAPQRPLLSNVTGTWLTADQAQNPDYWAEQLSQPVRFHQGLQTLLREQPTVLLEVGPGQTLTSLARQQSQTPVYPSLTHAKATDSDLAQLLQSVGQLWLRGATVNWTAFWAGQQRRREVLPTYPFERQRYWLEAPSSRRSQPLPSPDPSEKRLPIDQWFYSPSWSRAPQLEPPSDLQGQTWVLFLEGELFIALKHHLEAVGAEVILVQPAAEFAHQDWGYCLNPEQPEDYRRLVRSLLEHHSYPDTIVQGWSLTAPTAQEMTLDRGVYTALYLSQALADLPDPLTLWCLTHGVHDITGSEPLSPQQAPLVGASLAIAQDLSHLNCHALDLSLPDKATQEDWNALAENLVRELAHQPTEPWLAHRGGHRWLPGFLPSPLPTVAEYPKRLRPGGVYLITGGLAGLGPALAESLWQSVGAKLAFLEAEPLPPEDSLAADETAKKKYQARQRLEALGAEVFVVVAKGQDCSSLEAALTAIEAHFGGLHGVLHTAETTAEASFRPLGQTRKEDCQWQFAPKVMGLPPLAQALAGRSLDLVLVQSSIASQLGGFLAHAGANWFVDAYVQAQNRRQSTPWLAVNWEGWRFWESPSQATATLSPEEGQETLRRILNQTHLSQVVVSSQELTARLHQVHHRQRARTQDKSAPPRDSASSSIEQTVMAIWQDLLGLDAIDPHQTFLELGGHSLLAVQAISRIRDVFDLELPLRILLIEQPTVAGLAAAIAERLQTQSPEEDADLAVVQDLLDDFQDLSPDDLDELLTHQ